MGIWSTSCQSGTWRWYFQVCPPFRGSIHFWWFLSWHWRRAGARRDHTCCSHLLSSWVQVLKDRCYFETEKKLIIMELIMLCVHLFVCWLLSCFSNGYQCTYILDIKWKTLKILQPSEYIRENLAVQCVQSKNVTITRSVLVIMKVIMAVCAVYLSVNFMILVCLFKI